MPLLQLQLVDSGGTLALDVEGEPLIEQEYEHTEAGILKRYTERWRIEGGLYSLGTAATHTSVTDAGALWSTKLATLFAFLDDRTTTPVTGARLVRDPDSTADVERLLSSSVFQQFRIEDVTIGDTPTVAELEGAQWELVVRVDLTVSAERVFADADGVLEFSQVVDYSYTKGFQRVQWTTTVETAEGTDAETLARSLGAVPITEYGNAYYWVTNGTDGVDIRVLDGDERTTARNSSIGGDGGTAYGGSGAARTPTRVEATSIIQQTGGNLGGNTAGNSPQDPYFRITTETDRVNRTTTWEAGANGPGGKTWVQSKAPAGGMSVTVTDYDDERREYKATWVKEEVLTSDSQISAVITGGRKRKTFRELTGNKRPALQIGPYTPYTMTITVRREYVGPRPVNLDMPLPPQLPDPWVFDADASSEDSMPRLVEPAAIEASQRWERNATLVYHSGEKPDNLSGLAELLLGATVASYYDETADA